MISQYLLPSLINQVGRKTKNLRIQKTFSVTRKKQTKSLKRLAGLGCQS